MVFEIDSLSVHSNALETQMFTLDWCLTTCHCYNYLGNPTCTFGTEGLQKQKHKRRPLGTRHANTFFVSITATIGGHPLGHLIKRLFGSLGLCCLQISKICSSLGPANRSVSPWLGPSHFALESGAWRHPENDYLSWLPLALGGKPSKRKTITFNMELWSPAW